MCVCVYDPLYDWNCITALQSSKAPSVWAEMGTNYLIGGMTYSSSMMKSASNMRLGCRMIFMLHSTGLETPKSL